jgi:hypothetical protein
MGVKWRARGWATARPDMISYIWYRMVQLYGEKFPEGLLIVLIKVSIRIRSRSNSSPPYLERYAYMCVRYQKNHYILLHVLQLYIKYEHGLHVRWCAYVCACHADIEYPITWYDDCLPPPLLPHSSIVKRKQHQKYRVSSCRPRLLTLENSGFRLFLS